MKNLGKIFLLAFLQAGVILALPLFIGGGVEQETAPPTAAAVMAAADEPEAQVLDKTARISLLDGGRTVQMSLEDYLFGVVAAEMPASFEPEALKAQAVAARTYAMYRIGSDVHDGAVCTDASCCQAWLSEDELSAKWGAAYDEYAEKMRAAISETDGLCVTYDGAAILAAFHSSSNGRTESSENVFGKALPYLLSVESMEDVQSVPNYISSVTLTEDELYSTLAAWNSEAAVHVSEGPLLSDAVFSTTGRLISVKLCGEEVSGSELRRIFSLRSADISWQRQEDGISFTVTGYGHGVGMSQYGANNMAKLGASCGEILSHYYTGTSITPISALAVGTALL
ncbi:MAG: stage II sporulation protein D [Clostridiales bacterium]|nr:stage II sporulation protein D [Clostridiales bacterium]